MQPALRSNRSAFGLLFLLVTMLLLPVICAKIGLPPKIEAYKSISTSAGSGGAVVRAIYDSPKDADIVFLGSSLVTAGVSKTMVSTALDQKLKRTSSVQVLAMNWPGLDLQYFMLRDFLAQHRARLVVWNLPEPHSRAYDYPHVQSYRWVRFGEYSDALAGLPLKYQAALYGEMVIGAPRQLLSKLRPNRTGSEGIEIDPTLARSGYYGSPFVEDDSDASGFGEAKLQPLTSSDFEFQRVSLGPYQRHFAKLIAKLVQDHGSSLILLHIPLDVEFGEQKIPELEDWQNDVGKVEMIAAPSSRLFGSLQRSRFDQFYRDTHLNQNGQTVFTRGIISSLLKAYDEKAPIQEAKEN